MVRIYHEIHLTCLLSIDLRYKFQPIQRYKALSAEEAEQEFSKRNKHLNYFSLMLRKRLKGEEDTELEEGEEGKTKKGSGKKSKGMLLGCICSVCLYCSYCKYRSEDI